MSPQQQISAAIEKTALRLSAEYTPPMGCYAISPEEDAAAEAWLKEWNRTGNIDLKLTPSLRRALWPRFYWAVRFLRSRESYGIAFEIPPGKEHLTAYYLLVEAWPTFRKLWAAEAPTLN